MAQKVLVADDSIASQRLFEMVLTREGYDVITVGSGSEVIDRVKEKQPDIALIDAIMPELDGYQICETLKQNPDFKNLPIILLAGTHEGFDQEKGIKIVGENAILNKPAKSNVIISKVKEVLEQQEAEVAEQALDQVEQVSQAEGFAGVVEEPQMVEEAYEFDEDSEEVDMVVEDEILEAEAEFEEVIGDIAETEESFAEPEEEPWTEEQLEAPTAPVAETPAVSVQESLGAVKLSDEKLDMIVNEITQRLAGKLIPILVQELASSLVQIPTVKSALEETSKKLLKEVLPEIQKEL